MRGAFTKKKAAPLVDRAAHRQDKTNFARRWRALDNKCIVQLDDEDIGWFSCTISKTQLTVENLHFLGRNRGVPSIVLNILVLDARGRDQKALLRLSKRDSMMTLFRGKDFPIVEDSGDQVTIDISFQVLHWHRTGGEKWLLPWNKNASSTQAPDMPMLEYREATADDFNFAWNVYAENVRPLIGGWAQHEQQAKFAQEWRNHDNKCIIRLDGEDIGWLSCVMGDAQVTVDNLHFLAGHPGIPSAVLNALVLDAHNRGRKVSLRLFRNDLAINFFKIEDFPMEESADGRVTIDVSFQLSHWRRLWKKKIELPWTQRLEESDARVPA